MLTGTQYNIAARDLRMKSKERKNIQDGKRRNEHSHKDNVYGNMVELDKEPTLAKSIEIDEASTTMDNDISDDVYVNVDDLNKEAELKRSKEKKTPKTMNLAMSEEMSHQKNHENVKQNFLQDIKAINKTLEIVCRTCPPEWKPIGLFCYYFSTDTLSWDNAKDECVRKGSALAFLKNKDETDALKASLENGRYWIGLRRDTDPGKWKWVDGSMLTHSTWKKGEPNNLQNEDCAESESGYWNDLTCERKLKYICKKWCCC
ncbi:CD209 antigen-like protein C isoform X6 [Bufo bufo]|uniref:CD209 antigen-like protein C isoform X6 n=1 Tax=Bufo bufo TaxID=8384 RepID=UPI001ABE6790|nr:CD209 antigen-like protein C isoform X6 [Bufo bufo]